MKSCSRCREDLPLSAFGKHKRMRDGLQAICRTCKGEVDRAYYAANRDAVLATNRAWAADNPEKHREYRRKWDEAHPEYQSQYRQDNRERLTEQKREWARANPEKVAASVRRWREENPDWVDDYYARYQSEHPEVSRQSQRTRRARKLDQFVEHVERAVVWDRDAGVCGICYLPANPARWDIEHIIPLDRGGLEAYANVRVSHPLCNRWKGTRLDSELPPIPPRILKAAQAEADLALAA